MIWLVFRYIKLQLIVLFGAPPIIPPPPTHANFEDPCPVCGTTEKKSIKSAAPPNGSQVALQFTCAVCEARWFLAPVRPGTSVNEAWPAVVLESVFDIPTVTV
jgi:hypothetical protein